MLPQWLISLGSIVGLLTGVHVLFERLVRSRPQRWLTKSAERRDGTAVKVRNPADQDIILIGSSVSPRIYDLANSWELDQRISATLDYSSLRLIYPGQTVELPLGVRVEGGKSLDDLDQPVTIRIYWRRAGSPWMPRIPLCLRLRTSDVTKLSSAEVTPLS